MNSFRFRQLPRTLLFLTCVSLLAFGLLGNLGLHGLVRADESVRGVSSTSTSDSVAEEKVSKKISPEQFHVVDETVKWTVLMVVAIGLGTIVVLTLIFAGARRMRRLTRSPLLKSKYDEMELLREKYRREVEGLDTPPPPSRENRR